MSDHTLPPSPPSNDDRQQADSTPYERWFDGLLDEPRSRRESKAVRSDPKLRARFEADLAIDASLRRSFAAPAASRRGPSVPSGPVPRAPFAHTSTPWAAYAVAAGVAAVGGLALAISLATRDGGAADQLVKRGTQPVEGHMTSHLPPEFISAFNRPRAAQLSLGDVFLDALALEFQPLLGCQMQDPWDAGLFAQLATAPCNQEQGVVVLGEWIDPRVKVANMVMLRRGENPIMLIVPLCEQETELCVAKDSGLYVHRGIRDGRTIFEVSPVPDSEVLACVDAHGVVTQEQL